MKVVSVVGARPQFVKLAVVSRALRRAAGGVREVLVHTGQHYDPGLSDIFFTELEIPRPDHQLGVGSGPHGEQTGRMLMRLEQVLLAERPAWVVIYGDTNSTLAGALAAAKLHIPVAHVEAGLRSYNRRMPEEVNRVLADHAASVLFAPTAAAVANLRREGIADERVHLVGDVMYDAALRYAGQSGAGQLDRLGLAPGKYALATVHRAENTDDAARLGAIVAGLAALGRTIPVVLPLHPRTRAALRQFGLLEGAEQELQLMEPLGYLEMLAVESNAALIATDSGGVQKEAFFFRVPCVTLRAETEWVELVEWGWNTLCPPVSANAVEVALREALSSAGAARRIPPDPYGGGTAAQRIASILLDSRARPPVGAAGSAAAAARGESVAADGHHRSWP